MPKVRRQAMAVVAVVVLLLVAAVSSCSSSSKAVGLGNGCSINSDCNNPLVCVFQSCHNQCTASRDCSSGERCVLSGTVGVCQLQNETMCAGGTPCQAGEVCGSDLQCRSTCTGAGSCIMGDYCLTSGGGGACYSASDPSDQPALMAAGILAPDGAVISDASVAMLAPDGSTEGGSSGGGEGGTTPEGGTAGDGGDGGGVVGNSCPNAQTQLGNIAMGDTSPYFFGGAALRTKNALLLFSGYQGPDPATDAGSVNSIYVQAFDPVTGQSQGPAQPFLATPVGSWIPYPYASAVAPTGEVALLYQTYYTGAPNFPMYASFFAPAADAGANPAGLTFVQTVTLEATNLEAQPQAIWSNTSKAFVFSWVAGAPNGPMKVEKYLPNGQSAGAASDPVPTDDPADIVYDQPNQGVVADSNGVFGVAYNSQDDSENPFLTVLDPVTGNEVGNPIRVAGGGATNHRWVTMGGTSAGFVVFYDIPSGGVAEALVPVSADGGVPAAEVPDGGDAGTLPGFQFSGTKAAQNAVALADDVGGVGGVGVSLLYPDGVAFAYVSADGVTHISPSQAIAHVFTSGPGGDLAGDYITTTNSGGSFGIGLWDSANHRVQGVATGCAQ